MTEVGLATLNPPSGVIKQGSIGPPIGGFSDRPARRGRRAGRGRGGRPDLDPHPQPDGRLLGGARRRPRRSSRDGWLDSGDLARADERRLPLVLRPQEAGDRPRRLQHQPATRSRARWSTTRRSTSPASVGVHDEVHGENVRAYVTLREGAERPSQRRPDRLLPRADRLQGARRRSSSSTRCRSTRPARSTASGLKRMAEDHLHPHGLS